MCLTDFICFCLKLNGKQTQLFPTSSSKSSEPCIVKIGNTFSLGRETQTVLVNVKGNAEKAKALRWSDAPFALAWDEPYILGLISDAIEVKEIL